MRFFTDHARRLLMSIIVSMGFSTAALACDNLIGYWPGEGNAADIACGNNGQPVNTTGFVEGELGTAFHFNGAYDYVEIPNAASYNFGTGDFSVAFRVKFNDFTSNDNGLIAKDTYAGGVPWTANGWLFNQCDACPNPGIGIEVRNVVAGVGPDTHARYPTSNFQTGRWYSLVGVRKSNVLYFYVDGVMRQSTAESAVTNVTNTAPINVGRLQPAAPQWFDGAIDEVKVFNRALSPGEVESLYSLYRR